MNFRKLQAANRRKTIELLFGMGILVGVIVYAALTYTAPNAFATGRNPDKALIAFTTGILNVMDREELQGVIAHELSHVKNRDTLVSAVAATTAGAIAILSDFLTRMMWFGGAMIATTTKIHLPLFFRSSF